MSKLNINILNKIDCTGCGVCFNSCPVNAISMKENNEGFLEPIIDENKCTKCGLCAKICPVLNPKYENKNKPDCYAFMASDDIRTDSASGGVFPVLAYKFLENGGYVSGAIWTDDLCVKHIVSDKIEDIEKMRSSKYLQSDINNCYKEIKILLDNNKNVLFTGTPCQVAGLKSFLRKDYKNLYCVDIVCHGVPSPKVFKKYIDENFNRDDILRINFKNKTENGWGSNLKVDLKNNNPYFKNYKEDNFYCLFNKFMINRQCCSNCKFNNLPRQGDITMGDFWGIKNKYDDKLGTSVVLVNNSKGNELLKILEKNSKLLVKQRLKKAIKKNPNIITSTKIHKNRDKFFNELEKYSLKELKVKYLDDKCDCMILNFWSAVNYGAILTCYGVQCLMEQLGYYPKVINYVGYPKSVKCEDFKKSFSYKFAQKYFNLTNEVKTYEDFYKLNKYCNTFIAGSDQVWRKSCVNGVLNGQINWTVFLLDFVRSGKKKISYAPSLGTSEIDGEQYDYEIMNYYLSQFDSISVREDKGKELLKENFDIDAEQIIDGIVHIPIEKLNEMTEEYKTDEKYIACFTLPYFKNKKWYKNVLKTVSERLSLPIKLFNFDYKTPVEEWLAFIKNAEFVITDSYHATLSAILFNIPFLQIMNNPKVKSRFDTIFRCLNIPNKTISMFDLKPDYDELLKPIYWNDINKRLAEERVRAKEWIHKALKKEIDNKFIFPNFIEAILQNYYFLNNKKQIRIKYLKAKILSLIMFGRKKYHYKEMSKKLKLQIKAIEDLSGRKI